MSFLKGVKDTIEFPVEITIPALDENDKEVFIRITPIVKYRRFKRSEARKIQLEVAQISQEAAKAFEEGDLSALFGDRLEFFDDLLAKNILGWRKMPGEGGEEVEFSPEVLAEALEEQAYYAGLMAGMRRALGWGEAPGSAGEEAKNS